jgi:hypothetical protein
MHGRCLCRAVQYSIKLPLISCAHCHCESCRRANSAAFVTWAKVPTSQLRVSKGSEKLTRYESSVDAYRLFCGICGSQLFMEYADEPESIYLTAASLDSTSDLIPEKHISYEERTGWFEFSDSLSKFHGKSSLKIK